MALLRLFPHVGLVRKHISTLYTRFSRKFVAIVESSKFTVSNEVWSAVKSCNPVVALESTIITHGMPYPHNFNTAKDVEKIIRENGVIPATIAVLKGKVCIGLENNELEELACGSLPVTKISRRDLPYALSQGLSGGTTVSATMLLAHRAGISIFVTGGIGGVHREVETSMDVSSDLTELGRTPVTVVSSGVKSILDIKKTLEYLETHGVCVATYGESNDFPAFFTAKSNCKSPHYVTSPDEAAKLIVASHDLALNSGILLAVPIPEALAADGEEVEAAIQQSLSEAKVAGVVGKDITPFILKRVNDLTSGKSLAANIALIKNNAKIGSLVAVALNKYERNRKPKNASTVPGFSPPNVCGQNSAAIENVNKDSRPPVVIGGSVVDFVMSVNTEQPKMEGGTYKGEIRQVRGGVGRNICEALQRLGHEPVFISAVGNDVLAEFILNRFIKPTKGIRRVEDLPTATYSSVLNSKGECLFGVGDMAIHQKISLDHVCMFEDDIKYAPIVVIDGNIPVETMSYILQVCQANNIPVWFEPTDINKATKPFFTKNWRALSYVSPNINELQKMNLEIIPDNESCINRTGTLSTLLKNCVILAEPLLQHIDTVLVTLGHHGILVIKNQGENQTSSIHYPAFAAGNLVSVSGSGDCLAAAFISSVLKNQTLHQSASSALFAAKQSLSSYETVPETLHLDENIYEAVAGHAINHTVKCDI